MTLLKGFAWITIGRFVAALLQAFSLILVARYAGPEHFGVLASFLGFVIVLQALFDFGISTYIIKQRAHWADDPCVLEALHLYQYLGVLLFLVLCSSGLILSYVLEDLWWTFVPLAIAGCLERQSDVRLNIAMADGDVWKNAFNLVTRRVVVVVVLLLGTNIGWDALPAYSMAALVAAIFSYLLSRKLVKTDRLSTNLTWHKSKNILSAAGPFWANSLGAQLRNLDVILVSFLASAPIAGYYGAVSRSVSPLRMVSSSLAAVMLPMAARSNGQEKSFLWTVVIVIGTLAGAYVALAVLADQAIVLVLGSQYLPAAFAFSVVLIGLIFASVSSVFTSILQARGWQKIVGSISIATSVMALVGVAVGASLFEVTGAAFGLSMSYVVQCAALAFLSVRARNIRREG